MLAHCPRCGAYDRIWVGRRISSPSAPAQLGDNRCTFGTLRSRGASRRTCVPNLPSPLWSLCGGERTTRRLLAGIRGLSWGLRLETRGRSGDIQQVASQAATHYAFVIRLQHCSRM